MTSLNDKLKLVELAFGAHLHIDLTLDSKLGDKFYRNITRDRSDLFTTSITQAPPFFFLHERTRAQCIILSNNLTFTEKKNFDNNRFEKNCYYLCKNLLQAFETNEKNFRVIGKIFRYRLNWPNIFESFKKSVSMFASDEVHIMRLNTTLKEKDWNIHVNISSLEEDKKPIKDTLLVECDINNADQDQFHELALIEKVFKFADEYNGKRLLPLLTKKLGLNKQAG